MNLIENKDQLTDSAASPSIGRRRISIHILTDVPQETSQSSNEDKKDFDQLSKGGNLYPAKSTNRRLKKIPKELPSANLNADSGCEDGAFHGMTTRKSKISIKPTVSAFGRPFTKKELERALPRKYYFSCHERALRDAGYSGDTSKNIVENRKNNTENELQDADIEKNKDIQSDKNIAIQDTSVLDSTELENVLLESTRTRKKSHENFGELKTVGKEHGHAPKRRPETAKMDSVECRPLIMYLEYVKENKQEFLEYFQTSQLIAQEKPCDLSLKKLGRAFELRSYGGKTKPLHEDVIVMAAKALGSRTIELAKFHKQKKADILTSEVTTVKQRPPSNDRRLHEKNTQSQMTTTCAAKDDEHAKSELEKRMMKAKEWCRSVPTNIFIKAKIQTLRKLGSDDKEMTNWLQAFKNCHYIRRSHF